MHIHVYASDGEVKFWLEPGVMLADSSGLTEKKLKEMQRLIEGRKDEIAKSWKKHFRR